MNAFKWIALAVGIVFVGLMVYWTRKARKIMKALFEDETSAPQKAAETPVQKAPEKAAAPVVEPAPEPVKAAVVEPAPEPVKAEKAQK